MSPTSVRALPGRAGEYLVIEGAEPSTRELARVASGELGAHVLSAPDGSLDFLRPIIGQIDRLIVTDRFCHGLAVLEGASSLLELDLWAIPDREVPFRGMKRLRSFAGWGRKVGLLKAVSTLEKVSLETVSDSALEGAVGRLQRVELTRASALSGPPRVVHPESVRFLMIHGARQLDLSSLKRFTSLEELRLISCKALTGVSVLGRMPQLKELMLEKCTSLDDLDALRWVTADRVRVFGLNPYDEDFRALVGAAHPGQWEFPKGSIVRST